MRPGVGRTATTPRFARKRALPRPADEEQRDRARRSDQRERQEAAAVEPGQHLDAAEPIRQIAAQGADHRAGEGAERNEGPAWTVVSPYWSRKKMPRKLTSPTKPPKVMA